MEASEFCERKLAELREILKFEEAGDDSEVMEHILDLVFNDPESSQFSVDELDNIIEKIFFKTRSKIGVLQQFMDDDDVTEIMVNGVGRVFVERAGEILFYSDLFDSTEEIEEIMRNIAAGVHREINEMNPIVDARLEDGSRVNGVYKNVALNGPVLTIRKFSEKYMTLNSLVENETITEEGAELLSCLVSSGYNIFISGGTSSGKTTFLNALAEFIPKEERIIVIEDSSELKLNNIENIVHLECRNSNVMGKGEVTMSQLIKSSLRMRPDRIIVGEVRGAEVLDMLQAMNTGHSSLSTGHGNSVEGMLRRLETMYLMAIPLHVDAIRSQISEAIDIMVHVEKRGHGKRRVVEIVEVDGYRDGEFQLNYLMKSGNNGKLEMTGNHLLFSRKAFQKGGDYADRLRSLGLIN